MDKSAESFLYASPLIPIVYFRNCSTVVSSDNLKIIEYSPSSHFKILKSCIPKFSKIFGASIEYFTAFDKFLPKTSAWRIVFSNFNSLCCLLLSTQLIIISDVFSEILIFSIVDFKLLWIFRRVLLWKWYLIESFEALNTIWFPFIERSAFKA